MIFFTSDLHLGHANAIAFTNRPFAHDHLGLRIYDAGVDANDCHPISLDRIAELMHIP